METFFTHIVWKLTGAKKEPSIIMYSAKKINNHRLLVFMQGSSRQVSQQPDAWVAST